jgi:hypothetical protein
METMTSKNPGSERALESRKTKNAPLVTAKYKLHDAVAQTTDAVVEEHGMGVRLHSKKAPSW